MAGVFTGECFIYPRLKEEGFVARQVGVQTAEDYFSILNIVLNDPSMKLIGDSRMEADMLQRLATVGLGRGLDFKWSKLGSEIQAALTTGYEKGRKKVQTTVREKLKPMNGWMTFSPRGSFETDWLTRAVLAAEGWAGPDSAVSHSAAPLFLDADGKPYNGRDKYTLTFDLKNPPPVSEFWSIPIYDSDGFFAANEIKRYTINSYMVQRGELHIEDDKLVIYIQKDKPTDPIQLKNWLPAPDADFSLTARFYGPYMPLVDGTYDMPRPVKTK